MISRIAPFPFELDDTTAAQTDARSRVIPHPIYSSQVGRLVSVRRAEPGEMARKVISRSNMKATYRTSVARFPFPIDCDSAYEAEFVRLAAMELSIHHVLPQPAKIEYEIAGKLCLHYPDFLTLGSSKTFWEIKTAREAQLPEYFVRTELMKAELPRFGYRYRVAIAEDLFFQPRRTNLFRVAKMARAAPPLCPTTVIAGLGRTPMTWGEIVDGAVSPLSPSLACSLVQTGHLTFNADVAWTLATVFTAVAASSNSRPG